MSNKNIKIEERVLGHILSKEEMAQVSGGDGTTAPAPSPIPTLPPVTCTPAIDNHTPTKPAR